MRVYKQTLLQVHMPNKYFIRGVCLLISPTETVWALYSIK